MQAVRFHGKNDIRLEEIPIPVCGRGQVKVRPAFVGICGTDLHEYLEGAYLIPTAPHPHTGEQAPVVIGHEFGGTVSEVGEGISGLQVGQRVVIQPILFDETCAACQKGLINCCRKGGFIGLSGWGGGLSEYIVVPSYSVFKIPDSISLEVAALIEPLAVAWHAVTLSRFQPNDSALILGGGPIGLAVLQVLKARGARKVILSEIATKRKQYAADFGADLILDPTKDDVGARCLELFGGEGVQVVFDAVGRQSSIDTALVACRPRGVICNIAIWSEEAVIQPNYFCLNERTYVGSATYSAGDFQQVIDTIALGLLKPDPMITLVIGLEEVEERGFKTLINDKDSHVKIIVKV
ncbi:hypothetical protein OIDMADRAFT_120325 [Oidiodendron maius Zn]|uniref:Enoyl reductase (ER) domain-containing protein n=1 Tax=Oidiodendron maius (strain Zn) TaxID=913774 RepID=A0A0C3DMN0_OIDMZ|nr:hypothetical protein OIDMADRAFT_120325 [Oidiodendron maius Zn]